MWKGNSKAEQRKVGWALNEKYIYGDVGVYKTGFLGYRVHGSDLPMIDTVIVEVANPGHPYGVRGVGNLYLPAFGGDRQCGVCRGRVRMRTSHVAPAHRCGAQSDKDG